MKGPSEINCKLEDLEQGENPWFDLTQRVYGRRQSCSYSKHFAKKRDASVVKMTSKSLFLVMCEILKTIFTRNL